MKKPHNNMIDTAALEKWKTKQGLMAIFKDVAMVPYNSGKAIYDMCTERGDSQMQAGFTAAAANLAPVLIGMGVGMGSGAVAGLATYYFYTGILAKVYSSINETLAKPSFPATTAFAAQGHHKPKP